MIATTHLTSKEKKSLSKGKDKFDYQSFAEDLTNYKQSKSYTFLDISYDTGIGVSLLIKIFNNKYNSDLSINNTLRLIDWMGNDITKYIKL